jgi:Cof subfamily protein (haloacid dehalogenase superfamily)
MTPILLVVSDVDGTLLTKDKTLTDAARDAVHRLHEAGVGFTITSSRPTIGMRFLVEPLQISLPIGPFNGGAIVDPQMNPIEQHLIPAAAAQRCIEVLNDFGVDVWLFTHDTWFVANPDGVYVPNEQRTIRADPSVTADFTPYLSHACKIVGASPDPALLVRCEDAMRQALGTRATAVRSQTYYLDVTPPGCDKGTFVETIARHLQIPATAIATIGDMQNDLAMFKVSGLSFAMGNATDDVKKQASRVTRSNQDDGFAGAIDMILANNAEG